MPTASCNNHASPSIEYTVQTEFDQERQQQRLDDVEKFLQDQGAIELPRLSHMFGSNQYPQVQLSPETTENSSMAMVSEFGWSPLAETSKVPDNGEQLAQLVAAKEPSVALVSDLGWRDAYNNKRQPTNAIDNTWSTLPAKDTGEKLAQLVAAKDPSGALVSDLGWSDVYIKEKQPTNAIDDTPLTSYSHNGGLDTSEITNNSTGSPSLTSCQVHSNQTITMTVPVVSATSLDQSRGQPVDNTLLAMAVEAISSLEANNSSLGTNIIYATTTTNNNNNHSSLATTTLSCPELEVVNYPGGPITEVARTRPSVIVSTGSSSRKGASEETDGNAEKKSMVEKNAPVPILTPDLTMDDEQDEVSPAVLEKRRKANARCKKYRVNK